MSQRMTDEELFDLRRYAPNPMTTCAEDLYQEARRARAREARLEAENKALREALEEIRQVRYGSEATDTDEEMIRYWSGLVREYRLIADRALRAKENV